MYHKHKPNLTIQGKSKLSYSFDQQEIGNMNAEGKNSYDSEVPRNGFLSPQHERDHANSPYLKFDKQEKTMA